MVDVNSVLAEEHRDVGFVEGPNNTNPWGPEQGINNASYCDSFASMVPYHNGYRWWPESQCGERGCAYCPSHVDVGKAHGEVVFDHASQGNPADILAGDLLFYDWNGNGVADHVETSAEDIGTAPNCHNYGANTGSPEGVHETWRNRAYLLCRLRPTHYRDSSPGPTPVSVTTPVSGPTPIPKPPSQETDMVCIFQYGIRLYIGVIGAWRSWIPTPGVFYMLVRHGTPVNNTDGTAVIQKDVFDATPILGTVKGE